MSAGLSGEGFSLLYEVSAGAAQLGAGESTSRWLTTQLESWCWLSQCESHGPCHVDLSTNCLGFLKSWWLDSKSKQTERTKQKLYCFYDLALDGIFCYLHILSSPHSVISTVVSWSVSHYGYPRHRGEDIDPNLDERNFKELRACFKPPRQLLRFLMFTTIQAGFSVINGRKHSY